MNNHLKYSLGGRLFGYRTSSTEKFEVTLGSIDADHYRNTNFYEELKRTADSVYREFGKDLVLFLSGGTDSEIVARNFLDIGVKPKCVTIKFKDGYNAADVAESEAIAKDLDLDLSLIEFDVKDFYRSGHALSFGKEIQCTQITYLMVYYNVMKLGAPAVMGGEALLSRAITHGGSYWYYTLRENEDCSAMRFSNKYNIPLVNEWFSYTPEMLLHYLEHPTIHKLLTDKNNYKLSSVSTKNAVLRELCPGLRQKIKTHGFERLLAFNYEAYRGIMAEQICRLEPSVDGIPMDLALKMLRGEHEY